MDGSSPNYKELFLKERARREEAERAQQEERDRREEEQRRREEEQRRREEAERAQEEAERLTRKTTLPEFLDACHVYLHSNLVVQDDASLSTKGDPSNANNKVRPEQIRVWEEFPELQEKIWQPLVRSDFLEQRQLTSINALQELGASISRRKMGSELDLHHFQRTAVEDQVTLIVERIYADLYLRHKYRLRGLVQFENHGNTLSPEVELEKDMQRMDVSDQGGRRSVRFHERQQKNETKVAIPNAALPPSELFKFARPRADQFCVYDVPGDLSTPASRTTIFITEYKPPHKLTLNHIYEGLEEMRLEDVVVLKETDGPKERCRRLLAATITQAFSYMILAGQEFGCIQTGEASIFLRVPQDYKIVYYYLSVPKNDIGASTGWDEEDQSGNRLHLTIVGQMLAFTLQALQTTPREFSWRMEALSTLSRWNIVYEDVLESIPAKDVDVDVSEFQPSPHSVLIRASPIRLRRQPRRRSSESCAGSDLWRDNHDGADDTDPGSPSRDRGPPSVDSERMTRGKGKRKVERKWKGRSRGGSHSASNRTREYCTHLCLLGLMSGGRLDLNCPNARQHGHNYHEIDRRELLNLLREQLSRSMDEHFNVVGRPGSRGVLFAVTLALRGYAFAAKCSPPWFANHLKHEASVYQQLRTLQGTHVPVCLGYMELPQVYLYEGRALLSCSLLLSFGGTSVSRHVNACNITTIYRQIDDCLDRIHALGIRHEDVRSPNVLCNSKTGSVMIIDFERAKMVDPRSALGDISANRKRKRQDSISVKQHSRCTRIIEGGQVKTELQALVKTHRRRLA